LRYFSPLKDDLLLLAPHAPLREHFALPADGSEAGEHRLGLVGSGALEGVPVDDQGEIWLRIEVMSESERCDLGTQSTLAVVGSHEPVFDSSSMHNSMHSEGTL
jgi:hypothetical protein